MITRAMRAAIRVIFSPIEWFVVNRQAIWNISGGTVFFKIRGKNQLRWMKFGGILHNRWCKPIRLSGMRRISIIFHHPHLLGKRSAGLVSRVRQTQTISGRFLNPAAGSHSHCPGCLPPTHENRDSRCQHHHDHLAQRWERSRPVIAADSLDEAAPATTT